MFALASDPNCDPYGTNEPKCFARNLNKPIRNFEDDNTYWLCVAVGKPAECIICPLGQAFDDRKHKCINYDEFIATEPCVD